jgi:hypothetical protein
VQHLGCLGAVLFGKLTVSAGNPGKQFASNLGHGFQALGARNLLHNDLWGKMNCF